MSTNANRRPTGELSGSQSDPARIETNDTAELSIPSNTGPYSAHAHRYRHAGWPGVLPVPPGTKKLSADLAGYTGHNGVDPSGADVQDWSDNGKAHWNIALRLPDWLIGIDVDLYKAIGAENWARLTTEHSALPATWRSSARVDGSGIIWFRVPPGLVFWGELAKGVEIIQRGHRYAMAPPSIHPDGGQYCWYRPDGSLSYGDEIPSTDTFPDLPADWLAAAVRPAIETAKADMGSEEIIEWVRSLPGASEDPACSLLRGASYRLVKEIRGAAGRHEAMRDGVLALLRLSVQGHRGIVVELGTVRQAFIGSVTQRGEGQRSLGEAQGEWQRALDGGVRLVRRNTEEIELRDPCRPPISPALLAETAERRNIERLTSTSALVIDEEGNDVTGQSSWDVVSDWGDGLAGRLTGIVPACLARTDGVKLWYPGRINGLLGPSESGKSWVALLAVYQVVMAGGTVVILDFEDDTQGVTERLLSLGIPQEVARDQVAYIRPDEDLTDANMAVLLARIDRVDPDLIVVDGVNAAMTLMGLDLLNNKDATEFSQRLLRPLAETGAAVGYVDHTPKNDHEMTSKGGIGAQAKRAMTTGAAIRVEVVEPFDRRHPGSLRLWVDKDRAGHVRRASVGGVLGTVRAVPNEEQGSLSLRIETPAESRTDNGGGAIDPLQLQIVDFLEKNGPSNKTAIRAHFPMRHEKVDGALEKLVSRRVVHREPGTGTSVVHTLMGTPPDPAPGGPGGVQPCPPRLMRGGRAGSGTDYWGADDRGGQPELPDPADDPSAE